MRELSVAEQRYQAVLAVISDGETVTDVAARFGVRRQTVHGWRRRDKKWKRWERRTPMELWQMDTVGGFVLADGTKAKALTGVDDHSRFCISAFLMVALRNGSRWIRPLKCSEPAEDSERVSRRL